MKKSKIIVFIALFLIIVIGAVIENSANKYKDYKKRESIMTAIDLCCDEGLEKHLVINDINAFKCEDEATEFMVYGHNADNKLGEISFDDENYNIMVTVYQGYYAVEACSEERRMHCTINHKYKPYDSGHFIFWLSGDNDTYYSRIDNAIGFENIVDKIKAFDDIIDEYYDSVLEEGLGIADDGQEISKNIGFEFSLDEQRRARFEEFAVSDNGRYAVLMRAFTSFITVNVYDSNSEFLFSYKFRTGQHVLLRWREDALGIYLCRSERILYYDSQGNLIEGAGSLDEEKNRDFILRTIEAHRVEMDDGTAYYASNNGISEDSRREKKYLLRDNGEGVTTLYVAERGNGLKWIIAAIVIIVIFIVSRRRLHIKDGE